MRGAAVLLALVVSTTLGAKDDVVVVKAGRIITVSGAEIEGGAILIRGGRIEAVGQEKDIQVPWDAKVIDASKKTVMPGWIEAHTFRGVDRPNENMPSVPFVSTFDSINPVDPYFEDALRQGVTSLFVLPGNQTMIGGQGCVLRPVGLTTEAMTVVKNHALKVSLAPRQGLSRMAHVAALRRELDEMVQYLKDLAEKKAEVPTGTGSKDGAPEMDVKKETMARFLEGKLTAFVYCPGPQDVLKAIELSKQYKFRMKLVVGRDCWKAADAIAKEKLDVVLPADMAYWETDAEKHQEVLRVAPALFHKAGVKFAFQTDASSLGTNYHWYQAAVAVKHGVPREVAIRASTLHAAEILDLADRFGSIEKGKLANLVVLTGDPLDAMTWVDQVLVEGAIVYEREKDEKLKRVLETKPGK